MASLATFPRSRRTGFIHKGTRFCTSEFALPDDVRGETNGDVSLVEAIGADASRDRIRAAVEMEGVALDGVRFSAHGTDRARSLWTAWRGCCHVPEFWATEERIELVEVTLRSGPRALSSSLRSGALGALASMKDGIGR